MRPVRTITGAALPLLLAGVAGLVMAPTAGAMPADDAAAAVAALRRAAQAGLAASFEGTQVLTAWTADGSRTQVLDVVQRDGMRWSQQRNATGAGGPLEAAAGAAAPATETVLALLCRGFRLSLADRDRAAGRESDVVIASRSGREAARWWLDVRTGLVLRQEVFDGDGRLRRMSAFLDLRAPAPAATRVATVQGAALRSVPGAAAAAGPGSAPAPTAAAVPAGPVRWAGVALPHTLAGLELVGVRLPGAESERGVLQATYTDGLSAVSMFVQPGRLDAGRLAGHRAQQWGGSTVHVGSGWPQRVVWQHGDAVLTLVADADQAAVRGMVAAMPAAARQDGMLAAVLGGLDTIVGWLRH